MTIRNAVTLLAVAAVITLGQNTAIGAPPSQTVIAALLVILNSGNTLDSDGDGILDLDDAFPEDADENLTARRTGITQIR